MQLKSPLGRLGHHGFTVKPIEATLGLECFGVMGLASFRLILVSVVYGLLPIGLLVHAYLFVCGFVLNGSGLLGRAH